ncbi:potassium channel family protein [Streptomyces sp. NRRL WC-3742]|uniref:potassium channel family protein n=1 Tax=Streptomyces sp. NRRL WC-3742 TaxID=1463934 RepID=UPI000A66BEC9|nr:potassium channel family protein [Streptomyces sp. NRRL WC-3742]
MRARPRTDLRTALWLLGACTALALAYSLLPLRVLGHHHPVLSWLVLGAALAGLSGLLLVKIAGVLQGSEPRPVAWLTFLIVLAVTIFAAAYYVFASQPGQFHGLRTRLDAVYFTAVTLATIGYGDITPLGQGPRLLVMLQIGYSMVFIAAAAGTLSRTILAGLSTHGRRND